MNHQPHVHPSRQSQVPPPPPVAPYHAAPQPPPPYYNPQPNPHHLVGVPPHHNPYHPPHAPHMSHPHPSIRRNKSSDPRQRHRQPQLYNQHPSPTHNGNADPRTDNKKESILDVLHIAADETKNFGAFAVTLSQIYGSRNVDGLPFGCSGSNSIEFDGRIGSSPILSFLPEAIDTPSKKVRVYELAPLAATDKRSYDELLAFFTKHERCPVVDKEYNMGILLYFVPPKLIFKKVDPSNVTKEKDKRKHKRKRTTKSAKNKTNFVELLKLNASQVKDDRLWMISITSTSKYLLFKQKMKDKESDKYGRNKKGKTRKKKKKNEADLSDIEISSDDSDNADDPDQDSGEDDDNESINGTKKKG
eukprot:303582_1